MDNQDVRSSHSRQALRNSSDIKTRYPTGKNGKHSPRKQCLIQRILGLSWFKIVVYEKKCHKGHVLAKWLGPVQFTSGTLRCRRSRSRRELPGQEGGLATHLIKGGGKTKLLNASFASVFQTLKTDLSIIERTEQRRLEQKSHIYHYSENSNLQPQSITHHTADEMWRCDHGNTVADVLGSWSEKRQTY